MHRVLEFLGLRRDGGEPPKKQARLTATLLGVALLGIFFLVAGNLGGGDKEPVKTGAKTDTAAPAPLEQGSSNMTGEEEILSKKLCEMLKKVEGAGRVEVSVRLFSSTCSEYAVNTTTGKKTTQEKDQSGGSRVITEDSESGQLVMNRSGQGNETPVMEREMAPQVAGVLVVAEGAEDARVKAKLFEASRVALGIEPQKILVVPMERGY